MDYSPITEEIHPIPPTNLEVVIIGRNRRSVNYLRGIVESDLPHARITIVTSPSRLRLPPDNQSTLIILGDYQAIKETDPGFISELREAVPHAWICITVEEDSLGEAFDLFGPQVDDLLPLGPQIAKALRDSYHRASKTRQTHSRKSGYSSLSSVPAAAVTEMLHDILLFVDGEGVLIYGNKAWRENFLDPAAGRSYLVDVVHPNDLHRLEAELQLAILENRAGKVVFRVKSNVGAWDTLQANVSGIEVEGVHLASICGRNTSELHRVQSRLQETERQIRLFESQVEDVIYRFDPASGKVQYVSSGCLKLTGYSSDEWMQEESFLLEKLVHFEDRHDIQMNVDSISRRGHGSSGEFRLSHRIVCKDGSTVPVTHRISLEWSRDGHHYWINGTIRPEEAGKNSPIYQEPDYENRIQLFQAMQEGLLELEVIRQSDKSKPELKCIACNPAFESTVGIDAKRIANTLFLDIFPGLEETPLDIDSEESLPEVLIQVASSGNSRVVLEYFWPHLRSYFNISAIPGGSNRVTMTVMDVTRRKQAEVRLEALLRGLPDTALYQTGGGVEYVSDGVSQMLGYPSEEFQKDRELFVRLIHPEDRDRLASAQQRWIKSGSKGVLDMEFRARHKDGHYIWILDRMSKAFTSPDGRQSSQGVMMDITARKEQEEERIRSTSAFEAIFQALPDLYFRIDSNAIIKDYRAGNANDLLLPPTEFLNKSMFEVLPVEIAQKLKQTIERSRRTGKTTSIEYELQLPRGLQYFEGRLVPIADEELILIVRNMTEKKLQDQILIDRSHNFQVISGIAAELNSLRYTDEICTCVASRFLNEHIADAVALFRTDDTRLTLVKGWSTSFETENWQGAAFEPGKFPCIQVIIAKNRSGVLDNCREALQGLLPPRGSALNSFAAFPLNYNGKLQGLLLIARLQVESITEEEVGQLEPVAHLLAAALNRAESIEELERSKALFEGLFEQSPISAVLFDASGQSIRFNMACKQLYGAPTDTPTPLGTYNIFQNPFYREMGLIPTVEKAFHQGEMVSLPPVEYDLEAIKQYRSTRKGKIVVSTTLVPIKDSLGRVVNVLARHKDLTVDSEAKIEKQIRGTRKNKQL